MIIKTKTNELIMPRLLTRKQFHEISDQAKFLAESPVKKTCVGQLKRFESMCEMLKPHLYHQVSYKLSELCSDVRTACGRVQDKQRKLQFVIQTLHEIEFSMTDKPDILRGR